jgi:transcription initiation factor IIE alpha subunit
MTQADLVLQAITDHGPISNQELSDRLKIGYDQVRRITTRMVDTRRIKATETGVKQKRYVLSNERQSSKPFVKSLTPLDGAALRTPASVWQLGFYAWQ